MEITDFFSIFAGIKLLRCHQFSSHTNKSPYVSCGRVKSVIKSIQAFWIATTSKGDSCERETVLAYRTCNFVFQAQQVNEQAHSCSKRILSRFSPSQAQETVVNGCWPHCKGAVPVNAEKVVQKWPKLGVFQTEVVLFLHLRLQRTKTCATTIPMFSQFKRPQRALPFAKNTSRYSKLVTSDRALFRVVTCVPRAQLMGPNFFMYLRKR